MKIKSIDTTLSNKVRFNRNISGKPLEIKKSNGNIDKNDYASIMLLNLMEERGLFDVVFKQVEADLNNRGM